jgi:hypothetical protein
MIRSFIIGLRHANRSWKMILLLLAANNLFTLPLIVPIFWLVALSTGRTLTADRMFAGKLDIRWIVDITNNQMPGFSLEYTGIQIALSLAVIGFIYLLLNTFFAGGIIEVFAVDYGHFTMRRFWAGCGAYFWRFFRLMLISFFFYGGAGFIYFVLRGMVNTAAAEATSYEALLYQRWGSLLLLIVMLGFVNMVFDYAKIRTVVEDSRGMFRETFKALGFSLRHLISVSALFLTIAAIGIGLFLLLVRLRDSIDQSSVMAVIGAILLGQTAIAARMWTRLTFFAAGLDFYRRYKPKKVRALPPELTADAESSEAIDEGVGESFVSSARTTVDSPESGVRSPDPIVPAAKEGLEEQLLIRSSVQPESEGKESR